MKKVDKFLAIILAILMMVSIIPITSSAATYSGSCGDNVNWTYDSSTYTLTISGTGDMYDYKTNNRPWETYEDKIKTVIINDGASTIGAYAFYSFGSVESIAIPESIYAIGKYAFNGCEKLTSITIPDSVTIIEERTFTGCENLNNITLPTNLTTIGNRAFYCCESLENITIPKGVTTIGDNVFSCCYSLKEITIPDSVISIGKNAFSTCKNLTNVIIPANVTTIGQLTFSGCVNLTTIMVDSENEYYSTNESSSVLFNKDKTTLILYLRKNPQTNYNIPDTVTTICDSAFIGCENLTSLTIGKNVEAIGDNAFDSCFGLTNLIIPDNVKTIGDYAFYNCFNLTSVKIGNSVTSIGNNAFSFNDYFHPDEELQLKELELGNSVTIIGEYAFCNSKLLTSVIIPVSVKTIEYGAFIGCNNIEDVYYIGSNEQWNEISIDSANNPLRNATIHYNYHMHKYNSVVTDTTCTEQGYTTYTCECGDSYVDDYVDALGHTPADAVEENYVAPTCKDAGSKDIVVYCSVCDGEISRETVVIEKIEHTLTEYERVISTPTCTEEGSKEVVSYCVECNTGISRETVTLPALGHTNTSTVEENYIAPTCTETGSVDKATYCSVCNEEISRVTEEIEIIDHIDKDNDGYCDNCEEQICNHRCHKSGILGFLWKILNIFNRIFGLNKVCECGIAHY